MEHNNKEVTPVDLEAWERQERTVTLTNKQWSDLTFYLNISTKYRKRELEAWQKLAQETKPDGSPKFANAADNAEFWQELIDSLAAILPKLEGAEV